MYKRRVYIKKIDIIRKEIYMDVVDEITDAINILNKVDEYGESLTSRLSELDSKEQDILHYIESNKINILWCYNIIKKIIR